MTDAPHPEPRPSVSVIVPVYNDARRLARCLDALAGQTYPRDRFEVVVVDNGSTEDIAGVVDRFPRARYLREDSPGSYTARNTGIEASDGAVLAFTDADCIPKADWLERGVDCIERTPKVGLVGGRIEVFYREPENPTTVEVFERVLAFPQRHFVEVNRWAATANMFTLRSVMDRHGRFDEDRKSGGDAEWGRRIDEAGLDLVFAADAVVQHPARRSWSEIASKEVRVAGGLHTMILDRNPSSTHFARYVGRMCYYTARKTASLLFGTSVMRVDLREVGLADRAKVALVLNFVSLVRITELLRLRWNPNRERAR